MSRSAHAIYLSVIGVLIAAIGWLAQVCLRVIRFYGLSPNSVDRAPFSGQLRYA
jgi:hypothetical protein